VPLCTCKISALINYSETTLGGEKPHKDTSISVLWKMWAWSGKASLGPGARREHGEILSKCSFAESERVLVEEQRVGM